MSSIVENEILDELVINVDQTPSKFVPKDNVTMAEKSSKHVAREGSIDRRGITVTALSETPSGHVAFTTHQHREDKPVTSTC